MLEVAHTTIHFQRLAAAARQRTWRVLAARALLLVLAAATLARAPGLANLAEGGLALALAAALPSLLAMLGWRGLGRHCSRLARRASARRASARVRGLARAHARRAALINIIAALIHQLALPTVNNRHLAHVAISARLIAQRPN